MLNDHLTPGRAVEVPRARGIVPALKARVAEARKNKIPVFYLCDEHQDNDPDLSNGTWPIHNVAGTQGAEIWPELAAQPGDHVVKKSTYSAFTGSKLAELLDELGADEIILTGCVTEVGISATATDALQRGFVVTVPSDCQAGSTALTEQLTLVSLSTMPPYDPRYLRAAARAADLGLSAGTRSDDGALSTLARHRDVQRAAALLVAGRLVAFPTETVYGLGGRADRDESVRAIFEAKGRPSTNPLIVHVATRDAAARAHVRVERRGARRSRARSGQGR